MYVAQLPKSLPNILLKIGSYAWVDWLLNILGLHLLVIFGILCMGKLTTFGIHTWDKDIRRNLEISNYNFNCKRQNFSRNTHATTNLVVTLDKWQQTTNCKKLHVACTITTIITYDLRIQGFFIHWLVIRLCNYNYNYIKYWTTF